MGVLLVPGKRMKLSHGTKDTWISICISLDKRAKSTKSFPNTENPFFNEYFVFEFHCSLAELLLLTILFELKTHQTYKKNVVVSELLVDLHSVWNQPGRCNSIWLSSPSTAEAKAKDQGTQNLN